MLIVLPVSLPSRCAGRSRAFDLRSPFPFAFTFAFLSPSLFFLPHSHPLPHLHLPSVSMSVSVSVPFCASLSRHCRSLSSPLLFFLLRSLALQ